MKLTSAEFAVERIEEGMDVSHAESLYTQALYLLGIQNTVGAEFAKHGGWPVFPDVVIRQLELGVQRKMLSTIHMMVSRLLSSQMGVKLRGLDPIRAEVLRQYVKTRIEGDGGMADIRAAGRDGVALGIGALFIGLEDDLEGHQKVCFQHVRPWYVLIDGHTRNLRKAKWICAIHHLPVWEAEEMFGAKAREFAFAVEDDSEARKKKREVVRVWEYWDLGFKGGQPTRILFLGHPQSEHFKREANNFGCLPVAICQGWDGVVTSRPYGRVANSIATESMANEVLRSIRSTVSSGKGATVVHADALDMSDVTRWASGEENVFIRQTKQVKEPPMTRVPAAEIPPSNLQYLSMLDRQYADESIVTDLDKGVPMSRRTTATEVDYLVGVSNANKTYETQQIAEFMRELATKILMIGGKFDRSTFHVEQYRNEVAINTSDPRSTLGAIINQEHYEVLVDTDSLTANDDRLKRALRLSELRELAPLVGQTISPQEYTSLIIEALDLDKSLIIQQQPAMPQMGGGIPDPGGQPKPEDVARAAFRGGDR